MAKRVNVEVANEQNHRNPIPTCVRLGDLILPSVISGVAGLPEGTTLTPEEEIERAFQRMKNMVEAAGGTVDGIGKITIYLKDFSHREFVNKSWLKMFPNDGQRPARHVMPLEYMPGRAIVQLDVIASV